MFISSYIDANINWKVAISIFENIQNLIEYFFSIDISYKRVLQISKYLYEELRISFNLHDAFLAGVLKKRLFTILAKDNIDKNPHLQNHTTIEQALIFCNSPHQVITELICHPLKVQKVYRPQISLVLC